MPEGGAGDHLPDAACRVVDEGSDRRRETHLVRAMQDGPRQDAVADLPEDGLQLSVAEQRGRLHGVHVTHEALMQEAWPALERMPAAHLVVDVQQPAEEVA